MSETTGVFILAIAGVLIMSVTSIYTICLMIELVKKDK
ncbi:hypothetical protein CLSA_c29520 [Clostridium saccharobutylicum DSM 13864]|uniref:Uncharacterized protein n=1 Tax=Clostridium saccharobutylicum DSM 13864 TaxID=1345695 RepID=U5MT44_CLOSA|nr:hypothetical protein CLSA_c29520 [Clostridium saccharobutylicum DSM 13864]